MGTLFLVTSCSHKFSFEEKLNFEFEVIELSEVTEDIVYEKCPDWFRLLGLRS